MERMGNDMKQSSLFHNACALLAAMIWGFAFVTQSMGAMYVGPFTVNVVRSAIAVVFLTFLTMFLRRRRGETWADSLKKNPRYLRDLLVGGVCCGSALTIATNLQQKGIETTTSGKAGFLTAMYIVIVPLFGLLLKKRVGKSVWIGVVVAVAGLYFLCIQEDLSIAVGDFYILLCAVFFALQILLVDHFVVNVDSVELSLVQFFTVAVISSVFMLTAEKPEAASILAAIWPLLYLGIFSSGIAYTLQIVAQKGSNPALISILLSLESVFAVIGGALFLKDQLSGREYFGCLLMLVAVVLAQLPEKKVSE